MPGDLHCHSKLSDGSAALEEIIFLAKKLKINTIAITDHDTQSGCSRAALIARPYGIRVIHGLEISAYDYKHNKKVHILCYEPQFPNRLEGMIKATLDSRKAANLKALEAVQKRFPINFDMVNRRAQGCTCIYKQHIMHAIMDAGLTDRIFCKAYDLCFCEGGLSYEKVEYPDVFEVLELVKDSGGISVLAHPYLYHNDDIIDDLIKNGLDGIEVWHPSADESQVENLTKIADKHKLLKTGGSDFHGMYTSRPHRVGKCSTPDEELSKLVALVKKKKAEVNHD
jgi:predicted metal-dependent phosphoesterase TrpH